MVKKGGKARNRSSSVEVDDSALKNPYGSPISDVARATANKQQYQYRGNSGSMSILAESFDSPYSPFFLHSADHPGLSIVAHVLDGSNYNNWSIAMRVSLDAKNKLSFVDGTLPRPEEDDSIFKIWSRCNSMVKSWIMNVVNQEIYDSILYYQDAEEMWNDLFKRFKVCNLPRKYQLEQSVMALKQGHLDLSAYYTKKKTLWEQLANTRSSTVQRCDCAHVKELIEDAETSRVIQFLMGLNDNFNNIRGQILNMKPRPSLTEIYNILDQDESQRSVGSNVKQSQQITAFQVHSPNVHPDNGQVLLTRGNFQKPKCTHCLRIGHTVEKCYKVHGYPPGYIPRQKKLIPVGSTNMAAVVPADPTYNVLNENLSKEQIQGLIAHLSTRLQPTGNTSLSVTAQPSTSASLPVISQISGTSFSLSNNLLNDMSAFSISLGTELSHRDWIVDSGATHHVTYNRNSFVDYKPLDSTYVTLPNNHTVMIQGIGTIQFSDAFSLHTVLHIPEFRFNLLSVSALTTALSSRVTFTSDACFIQALSPELMIGQGKQVGNLYVLTLHDSLNNVIVPGTFPICSSIHINHEIWHRRLGHPSVARLDLLSDVLAIPKVKLNKESSSLCHTCHLAKQKHLPFTSRHNICSEPFALIHLDTWGPFSVPTVEGFQYFLTIVDDFSRATWIYLLKHKSDVITVFPIFLKMVENQFNTTVKAIRSDNAHELKFTDLLLEKGIIAYHSCPETPEQNSVVERKHQHILNVARALLFQSHVPLEFWGDCVLTAVFLINRLPTPVLDNVSPYEKLKSKIPDYKPLKVFGCLCYSSTSTKGRTKFDPRARACVFLGYPTGYKGYKLLDIETHSVSISRHVIFHEDIFPFSSSPIKEVEKDFFPHFSPPALPDESRPSMPSSSDPHPLPDVLSSKALVPSVSKSTRPKKIPSHLQDFHCYNNSSNILYPISNHISYSNLSEPFCAFTNTITKHHEPQTYSEAKLDQSWCVAMGEELDAMERTKTWSICQLPIGKEAIGCKWVYTIKHNSDGSIERHKARLVAKGFTQTEGVDFIDTFSPVAKMSTVRVLLCFAAKMKWTLHQLDISNAFLNGDLEEEIFMKLPPGYSTIKGESVSPNSVCRLHKSIYGLKQASRQWFIKFSDALCSVGFVKSVGDHTLFVKMESRSFMAVLVYVDDIIIATNDDVAVDDLKKYLSSCFKLRDLGDLKYFLGLEVARSAKGISVSQRKYTLDLLADTGFLGSKPSSIPMEPNSKLQKDSGTILEDAEVYRRLVGKLMYLTITRPDISYAVSSLCQFSSCPTDVHLTAVHKVLRYLKGSVGQGLFYAADNDFSLRGFCDSDWASCPDTRRSVTGWCMFIGDSLVSWKSKKQPTVSRSTAEAEYRAMALATCELIWLSRVMVDLQVSHPPPAYLYCDNHAALHIASNPVFHERTKHIDIDCHCVREKIESGFLKTMHVQSKHQLADVLTKALYPATFNDILAKMGICNIYTLPS